MHIQRPVKLYQLLEKARCKILGISLADFRAACILHFSRQVESIFLQLAVRGMWRIGKASVEREDQQSRLRRDAPRAEARESRDLDLAKFSWSASCNRAALCKRDPRDKTLCSRTQRRSKETSLALALYCIGSARGAPRCVSGLQSSYLRSKSFPTVRQRADDRRRARRDWVSRRGEQ